jgi:uncharacterized membrane protein
MLVATGSLAEANHEQQQTRSVQRWRHRDHHHHMLHACGAVTGSILWANLHLLFWLSLFPVTTDWIGENPSAAAPSVLYGLVLLMAAIAYGYCSS